MLRGGCKDVESGGSNSAYDTQAGATNSAVVESRLVSPARYALCNTITLLGNLLLIPFSYTLLSLPMVAVVMVAVYEGSGMLILPGILLGFGLNFMLNTIWLAVLRR